MDFGSNLLANIYSGVSPSFTLATVTCTANGQPVDCSFFSLLGGTFIFFWLAVVILIITSLWRINTKAGKPGWAAIIPVYNIIVLIQIVKKPIWWIVLFFIPLVSVVMSISLTYRLAKAFGKGVVFTIGLVLLPFVFYPILGFSKAEYQLGNIPPSPTPSAI